MSEPVANRIKWISMLGSVAVALLAGFGAVNAVQAEWWVRHMGYGLMWLTVVWLGGMLLPGLGRRIWATWGRLRSAWLVPRRDFWSRAGSILTMTVPIGWRQLVVVGLIGTALAWMAEPTGRKILYDEYVLEATAQYLHEFRQIGTSVRGYEIEGAWTTTDSYIDKRPYFFAFVVSVAHDLLAYRPDNAFVVNHFLVPVLLFLTWLIAGRLGASRAATSVVFLLFCGLPLFGQNANGAGMELLNLVMISATIYLGLVCWEAPRGSRLSALVLVGVLLAQTRYESAVYILAVGALVLTIWWRERRVILTWAMVAAPLLVLPIAWLREVTKSNEILWQLPDELSSPFGLQHVMGNLHHAAIYLFSTENHQSNSLLLTSAIVAAVGGAMFVTFRRRRTLLSGSRGVVFVFGLAGLGTFGVLMGYFWGELDDPLVARLSLPMHWYGALLVAVCLTHATRSRPVLMRAAWTLAIVGSVLVYGRLTPLHRYTAYNLGEQEIVWERRWVAAHAKGPVMILTNKTALSWVVEHTPAILIERARGREDALRFHLEAQTFGDVLVMQRLRPTSRLGEFAVDPEDTLPLDFVLEPLIQKRFGSTQARISRLVKVLPAPSTHE